jgi:adenosylhomocysteine nucleosidase
MEPLLGLVVALSAEAKTILGTRGWKRIAGRRVRRFRLPDGTGMTCVLSGVGAGKALSAARWLVASEGATALASMGVSGGLDPSLHAGDLILPDRVAEICGNEDAAWTVDLECLEIAHSLLAAEGLPVHRGSMVTSPQAALTAEAKQALFANRQFLAVDMESAAVARAAGESNLPVLVVRAVCDTAERSVSRELFECLDENGRVRSFFLLRALVLRPSMAFDLARGRKEFAAALGTLRRAWQVQVRMNFPFLLASRGTDRGKSA